MNACIIYLKDGENSTIEVVMELIGDPNQSFSLGKEIVEDIAELQGIVFCDNEFSADCPTKMLQ